MFETIFYSVAPYLIPVIILIITYKIFKWIVNLRRVVPTNEVHIVQSSKLTTSYGKDTENGNTYYEWPSWIPVVGITKIILPVSVFDLDLTDYEAYDKGRLPFKIDVKAFFRIADSNLAAQRVASFDELHKQLQSIVQGAVRAILASNDIEDIMQGRATFGEQFTHEVASQLTNWGVVAVKNIELMDIRDSSGSNVIHNIMEKKKSFIEMESRTEVAANMRTAQIAEVDAQRETDIKKQQALQQVGIQTAEKEREIGIANQKSTQAIQDEQRITKEKEMAVIKVGEVNQAEINKQVQVVMAEQEKQTSVIQAEGIKQRITIAAEGEKAKAVLDSEGKLEAKKRESEGITLEGTARAEAEKAMQLAPVQAQIVLAKEIGGNASYQQYLITVEQIKANQVVGVEQAKALEKADIKIIANTGDASTGLSKLGDVISPKGGLALGGMLEAFAQTDTGKAVVEKMTTPKPKEKTNGI
jgi:flotillin